MTVFVYLAIYAGLLVFIVGSAWRAWTYAHLPVHLRWELYPVPHEEPRRAYYGGSYFEEQEWWRRPQRTHRLGEWLAMAEEILLLKSLRESNRRLWLPSSFFHWGIYLTIAAVGFSGSAALAGDLAAGGTAAAVSAAAKVLAGGAGFAGSILILMGAASLLLRRIADPALKNSTKPGDLFNLIFFLAAFGFIFAGYLLRGVETAAIADVARGAVHFDLTVRIGNGFGIGLILASALAAYIPFTHMAHYVAKYFTWHTVRWDDRRSEQGSAMEREVAGYLAARPTWKAQHIGADGERSWAEVATRPTEELRR